MSESAHNSIWQTSEVLITCHLVIGGILKYFLPLKFHQILPLIGLKVFGIAMTGTGLYIFSTAKRQLSKMGKPTTPQLPTTYLVTDIRRHH